MKHETEIGNGRSAVIVKDLAEWNNLWAQGVKINTANMVRVFDDFDKAFRWVNE